jgi:hypothetical protein
LRGTDTSHTSTVVHACPRSQRCPRCPRSPRVHSSAYLTRDRSTSRTMMLANDAELPPCSSKYVLNSDRLRSVFTPVKLEGPVVSKVCTRSVRSDSWSVEVDVSGTTQLAPEDTRGGPVAGNRSPCPRHRPCTPQRSCGAPSTKQQTHTRINSVLGHPAVSPRDMFGGVAQAWAGGVGVRKLDEVVHS